MLQKKTPFWSRKTIQLIFFVVVITFSIIYWILDGKRDFYSTTFNGVISSMRFNDKNTPIVKFNNDPKEYIIPCVKGEINAGDSLVKRQNSDIVRQYRKGDLINEFKW
jgi:hypothetical protein